MRQLLINDNTCINNRNNPLFYLVGTLYRLTQNN